MISSILSVTEAARRRNLSTVDRLKIELGISDSSQDDALELFLGEASAKIETYCNRVFATETVQQTIRMNVPPRGFYYEGPILEHLCMDRFPIGLITAITEDEVNLTTDQYEVDYTKGLLYRIDGSDNRVNWTFKKLVVSYIAGYTLPGQTNRNLPMDVESACVSLVKSRWYAKSRDPMIKSVVIPQVMETTYWVGGTGAGSDNDLPPDVVSLLNPYRTRSFFG